jgi:hypothetical protein
MINKTHYMVRFDEDDRYDHQYEELGMFHSKTAAIALAEQEAQKRGLTIKEIDRAGLPSWRDDQPNSNTYNSIEINIIESVD